MTGPDLTPTQKLTKLATDVADELERNPDVRTLNLGAGILRHLATLVATGPDHAPDRCATCGHTLEQPPTGRRRLYCNRRCQRRHGRNTVETTPSSP